ncbi:MAG: hypothetical protein J0L56_08850 [Chitinophagales bacterium]|nr:hypothetical protein [Chitinophagales bacterium]
MRILMIVEPGRKDFYSYLQEDQENEYLLLWYESKQSADAAAVAANPFFKENYYWDQFITPNQLLKKIKPDKIVFFEIIDQRQIALVVAARKKKITTFYLEHGAAGSRETAIERTEIPGFVHKQRIPYILKRIVSSLPQVIRTKIFYYSNFSGFSSPGNFFSYFKLPLLMLTLNPNKALARCLFPERVPRYSIVFNRVNLEEHQLFTGITEADALLTGLPFFDSYYRAVPTYLDHIVYIEQPYLEQHLENWTVAHHQQIAERLLQFANTVKRKVYVKLHPRSDRSLWKKIEEANSPYLTVLQAGDFTDIFLSSSLILGYSSSLLTGFLCARKNVVLLGWHPEPGVFGNDFSKTGLCHYSGSVEELFTKISYWEGNNLCVVNEDLYNKYLLDYNFPFDGQASKRVLKAIQEL